MALACLTAAGQRVGGVVADEPVAVVKGLAQRLHRRPRPFPLMAELLIKAFPLAPGLLKRALVFAAEEALFPLALAEITQGEEEGAGTGIDLG